MDRAARQAFLHRFDTSLWEELAREARMRPQRAPHLGEGRHFQVFHWAGHSTGDRVVLRVAKPAFKTWQGPWLGPWLAAINRLGNSEQPLIPPMMAWEAADGSILMLMPYLPHPIRPVDLRADAALQGEVRATTAWLAGQGLVLGDDWLIHRDGTGLAYIVDWSELSPKEASAPGEGPGRRGTVRPSPGRSQ